MADGHNVHALDGAPSTAARARGTRVARVTGPAGTAVCERCELADTFVRRLRGLLGRTGLDGREGLLLRPAGSVHTAFMRFHIDVVLLDRDLRVLKVAEDVGPWRVVAARRARAALELRAGEARARGLAAGDVIRLEEVSDVR